MTADEELSELLFFDTFSHDINEELNLDLVQFPKPVYITELRIIPLGARVEADFRGGVRLGATNPSAFEIDFFVNDLTKPGASTFERLGNFMYNQNDCINMVCEGATTIPTDGLVLRGWYTTITLAVYGTLTKNVMEQIASPPAETTGQLNDSDKLEISSVSMEEPKEVSEITEPLDEYTTPPKDPRQFPVDVHSAGGDWKPADSRDGSNWEKARTSRRSPGRRKSETRRSFSRSSSRDENYAGTRDWSRSPDFQSSRRSSRASAGDARKRPQTPPLATEALSPVGYNSRGRPRSPDQVIPLSDDDQRGHLYRSKEPAADDRVKGLQSPTSTPGTPLESPGGLDDELQGVEQFELIESDEEIGDDMDQFDLEFDEYEESLKMFNPLEVARFPSEVEQRKLQKEFEVIARVLGKLDGLRKADFTLVSRDERENWVHAMERVTVHLGHVYNFQRAFAEPHVDQLLAAGFRDTILQSLLIGLDYECAMAQVAYKVRHLKVGLRFAELICCYDRVADEVLLRERCNLFQCLFDLYNEQFMALSLQMMILKTVGSILDTRPAVLFFLDDGDVVGVNYYQRLLKLLEMNPKIYLKFSLKAIVRKLNVFEALEGVKQAARKMADGQWDGDVAEAFDGCVAELLDTHLWNDVGLVHSKHFVPVPQKIEIVPDEVTARAVAHYVDSYFRTHALVESLAVLVVQRQQMSSGSNRLVLNLLRAIARNSYGFLYLVERFETTMLLVRSLLQHTSMGEWQDAAGDEWLQLGVEVAYKLQTKYHLDAIQNVTDEFEVVDHLTALANLAASPVARAHVLDVLCMDGNLAVVRGLIEAEKQKVLALECSTKYKSPILSYSVDLLDCFLRHNTNMRCLQENGKALLGIAKSYDIFESNVSAMLQELLIYLKPLDQPTSVFNYDDAALLCDLMKKSFEFFTTFPGDLITCLRVALTMAVPSSPAAAEDWGEGDEELGAAGRRRTDYRELKHKLFLVQFYAADGYAILVTILEKVAAHFQQPKMHSSNLAGNQGVLVLQVVLPTVQILRRVLVLVMEARNTDFKDVSAVVPLLNVYNLLHNIPGSAPAHQDAQRAQVEIVRALLCYTQPSPADGVDNESVMKSLWSQVVGEVIKFAVHCPSTFIPGLLVLSEMLPLPLPLPATQPPAEKELQRLLTERQLWSAYLYPQTNAIVELIQTLSPTSYPPLIMLLQRVCLQMADLGPNMSVVVGKTLLELFMSQPVAGGGLATTHHLRLMSFLGNLMGHASVKSAVLSLLSPRLMDMLNGILAAGNGDAVHQQTQESILVMYQSLLDAENSFYSQPKTAVAKELVLASVIPSVEVLHGMMGSCLDHLLLLEANVLTVLRTLMLFTEHDVTLRMLRSAMDARRLRTLDTLRRLLATFIEQRGANPSRELVTAILEFLRLLMAVDATVGAAADRSVPSRTVVLSRQQLAVVLGYCGQSKDASVAVGPLAAATSGPQEVGLTEAAAPEKEEQSADSREEVQQKTVVAVDEEASSKTPASGTVPNGNEGSAAGLQHPLLELREFLKQNQSPENDSLLDKCNEIISFLEGPLDASDELDIKVDEKDAVLPPAEGIVAQYAMRRVFVLVDAKDERLKLNYWLNPPNYDMELGELEQVPYDLTELIRTCLPADTNVVADCKRILNLSVSPQSSRERTVSAPCFRTRRIEMEPLGGGGRMDKKIFGKVPLRGRGYARTPPSRGDLFRSRPPNTSRPPSLHVDDFLALEGSGQNNGPAAYNKSGIIGGMRGRGRGRGVFQGVDKGRVATGGLYRQTIPTWSQQGPTSTQGTGESGAGPTHFRTATQTPQYGNDTHHYHRDNSHFVGHTRGRGFYKNRIFPR